MWANPPPPHRAHHPAMRDTWNTFAVYSENVMVHFGDTVAISSVYVLVHNYMLLGHRKYLIAKVSHSRLYFEVLSF